MVYSSGVIKANLGIKTLTNTFIERSIIEKISNLAQKSYNIKLINKKQKANPTKDATNTYEEIKNDYYGGYDAFITLSTDSSMTFINYSIEIKNKNFQYIKSIEDNKEWVEKFSVDILEELAVKRFYLDKSWNILQLTYYEGVDEYSYFDDDKLYFISDRYIKNREVYIWDFMKSKKDKIKLELSSEYFPQASINHKKIVFQSTMFGKWDIVIYDLENEEFKRITSENENGYSPYFWDQNTILYTANDKKSKYTQIWKYDINTGEKTQITDQQKLVIFRPTKYEENKILFYATNLETANSSIYYIENGEIINLFKNDNNQSDNWSNKNGEIVYSQFTDGNYKIFYHYENMEKNLTYTIKDDCYYPMITENGEYVFFSLYYGDSEPDIYIIRL
jgi:TolB protein